MSVASGKADLNSGIDNTPIGKLSSEYMERYWALNPIEATYNGVPGYNHLLPNFSYGDSTKLELDKKFLELINNVNVGSESERISLEVFKRYLIKNISHHEEGLDFYAFGVITSPLSEIRAVFNDMGVDSKEERDDFYSRIKEIPKCLENWSKSLVKAIDDSIVNTRFSTLEIISQLRVVGRRGDFESLVRQLNDIEYDVIAGREVDSYLEQVADFLEENYLPHTRDGYGVGSELYKKFTRGYLDYDVDLLTEYESAIKEIEDIDREFLFRAQEIYPGVESARRAAELLDEDSRYKITSKSELIERIRNIVDEGRDAVLNQFDIPSEIMFCDVKLDESSLDAAPYYNSPALDLSRPGTMYYPTCGASSFPIWRSVSTIYHEGIPGHHLQNGISVVNKEKLSEFQKSLFLSGYGEGWALYAERLMDELGFFENPAYKLGHLIDKSMRVARVVVDIGLHLELESAYGGVWDYEKAVRYFMEHTLLPESYIESEIKRYIGWPGQAITYRLGEKHWIKGRERALEMGISAKKYHKYMLEAGTVQLSLFDEEVERFVKSFDF